MALLNSPTYVDPAVARTSVPVVEVREVRKTYQLGETEVHALRGVSVNIKPAILSPSWAPVVAASPPS